MPLAIVAKMEAAGVPLIGRMLHHYQRIKSSHAIVAGTLQRAEQAFPVRLLDRVACQAWDSLGKPLYGMLDSACSLIESSLDNLLPPPMPPVAKDSVHRLANRVVHLLDRLLRHQQAAQAMPESKPPAAEPRLPEAKPNGTKAPEPKPLTEASSSPEPKPVIMVNNGVKRHQVNNDNGQEKEEEEDDDDENFRNQLAAVVEHLLAASNEAQTELLK